MPCDSSSRDTKMEHTTGSPTRLVKVNTHNTHTRRVRYIYRCRYICLSAFLYVSIIILCYLQASFLSSVKGKKFPCEKWKWNARRKSCPKIDDSIGTQEAEAEKKNTKKQSRRSSAVLTFVPVNGELSAKVATDKLVCVCGTHCKQSI